MKYCVIEIITQTATFRNPDFQNFHKTLLLPPPSTIIGFAGAALGLSHSQSFDFFEKNDIKLGVYGKSLGMVKDLWKYRKDFNGEKSIIKKEILYKNFFYILFVSENKTAITELSKFFLNPKYALTMGNSDSLAFIKKVDCGDIINLDETFELEHCIVEGDILKEVTSNFNSGLEISIYNTSDPITYDLPVKFQFESDYGMRNIISRKSFSFISKSMKLNIKKKGINYEDKFIPILSL